MKYEYAQDLQQRMMEIVQFLGMNHIKVERVECLRSYGSSTKRTIARCHALGKLMQKAMKTKAFYAIEFLEIFEKAGKIFNARSLAKNLHVSPPAIAKALPKLK